jgi:hypothetical protein
MLFLTKKSNTPKNNMYFIMLSQVCMYFLRLIDNYKLNKILFFILLFYDMFFPKYKDRYLFKSKREVILY